MNSWVRHCLPICSVVFKGLDGGPSEAGDLVRLIEAAVVRSTHSRAVHSRANFDTAGVYASCDSTVL